MVLGRLLLEMIGVFTGCSGRLLHFENRAFGLLTENDLGFSHSFIRITGSYKLDVLMFFPFM